MTCKTIASALLALIASAVFTANAQAKPTSAIADIHSFGASPVTKAVDPIGRRYAHRKGHVGRAGRSSRRAVSRAAGHHRSATTDRSCLTADTRSILDSAERNFNTKFTLVSTCRPGAVIAGTSHASQHRYGRAVDLHVPSSVSKQAVVKWLYANAPGVTMVYRGMSHIHFDTGPYHSLACGGCGVRRGHIRLARKATRHRRYAHAL